MSNGCALVHRAHRAVAGGFEHRCPVPLVIDLRGAPTSRRSRPSTMRTRDDHAAGVPGCRPADSTIAAAARAAHRSRFATIRGALPVGAPSEAVGFMISPVIAWRCGSRLSSKAATLEASNFGCGGAGRFGGSGVGFASACFCSDSFSSFLLSSAPRRSDRPSARPSRPFPAWLPLSAPAWLSGPVSSSPASAAARRSRRSRFPASR